MSYVDYAFNSDIERPELDGDTEFDLTKIILSEKDKLHPNTGEVCTLLIVS